MTEATRARSAAPGIAMPAPDPGVGKPLGVIFAAGFLVALGFFVASPSIPSSRFSLHATLARMRVIASGGSTDAVPWIPAASRVFLLAVEALLGIDGTPLFPPVRAKVFGTMATDLEVL